MNWTAKKIKLAIGTFILVLITVIGLFVFIEKVDEGNVAVVYSPSGGATRTLAPGWSVIKPFEKTTEYPVRIQTASDAFAVTTSDGKKINVEVRYQYKVSPDSVLNIFRELGSQDIEQIQVGYLSTNLFRVGRSVISDYSLYDVYGESATEISGALTEMFAAEVSDMGFIISDVTMGTPEADAQTQAAIDARVQASQENELKKQELENEKIDAQKRELIAESKAREVLIEAEAEAEANETVRNSITSELIQKQWIDKWDGVMPTVSGTDSGIMLDLPSGETTTE